MDTPLLQRLIDRQPASQRAKLIETHISWVLLIGDLAYKLKKPVQYDFIDARDFETRRHFCERELELNRRLAPELYLDMVPVYQQGEELSLEEGPGRLVEYAVKLQRLDPARQMDHLLEEGAVHSRHLRDLAYQLADFHRQAEVVDRPEAVSELRETFQALAETKPLLTPRWGESFARQIDDILEVGQRFLHTHESAFVRRNRDGFLRDGHGDLHAGNIFLYDQPIVFDCIEFKDEFRQIDVLNEVAFLCLSLDVYRENPAYQQLDLTDTFLRHYLTRFRCYGPEDALLYRFYLLLRANIKLKVNAIKLDEASDPQEQETRLQRCTRYFALLTAYAEALA
jgi:uncharacterized protein